MDTKLQQLYNWCEGEKEEQEFDDIQDIYDNGDSADLAGGGYEIGYNNALAKVQEKIKELEEK